MQDAKDILADKDVQAQLEEMQSRGGRTRSRATAPRHCGNLRQDRTQFRTCQEDVEMSRPGPGPSGARAGDMAWDPEVDPGSGVGPGPQGSGTPGAGPECSRRPYLRTHHPEARLPAPSASAP